LLLKQEKVFSVTFIQVKYNIIYFIYNILYAILFKNPSFLGKKIIKVSIYGGHSLFFGGMVSRFRGNDRKSNEIMRLQHRFDPRNDRGVRWKANSF